MTVQEITIPEVIELLKEHPKLIIDIDGNINQVMIVTNKKRKIVGYIQKFYEIIPKED